MNANMISLCLFPYFRAEKKRSPTNESHMDMQWYNIENVIRRTKAKKKKKKNEKRTANFEKMTQNLDYVDLWFRLSDFIRNLNTMEI